MKHKTSMYNIVRAAASKPSPLSEMMNYHYGTLSKLGVFYRLYSRDGFLRHQER